MQKNKVNEAGNTNELIKCCICGKDIQPDANGWMLGHNPSPLYNGENDRCCDTCNWSIVIPERLHQISRQDHNNQISNQLKK
jgi:hypothetical protein